jgi:hypothetical protein
VPRIGPTLGVARTAGGEGEGEGGAESSPLLPDVMGGLAGSYTPILPLPTTKAKSKDQHGHDRMW